MSTETAMSKLRRQTKTFSSKRRHNGREAAVAATASSDDGAWSNRMKERSREFERKRERTNAQTYPKPNRIRIGHKDTVNCTESLSITTLLTFSRSVSVLRLEDIYFIFYPQSTSFNLSSLSVCLASLSLQRTCCCFIRPGRRVAFHARFPIHNIRRLSACSRSLSVCFLIFCL